MYTYNIEVLKMNGLNEEQINTLFETCDFLITIENNLPSNLYIEQRNELIKSLVKSREIIQSLKKQVYSDDLIKWLTQLENSFSSIITNIHSNFEEEIIKEER